MVYRWKHGEFGILQGLFCFHQQLRNGPNKPLRREDVVRIKSVHLITPAVCYIRGVSRCVTVWLGHFVLESISAFQFHAKGLATATWTSWITSETIHTSNLKFDGPFFPPNTAFFFLKTGSVFEKLPGVESVKKLCFSHFKIRKCLQPIPRSQRLRFHSGGTIKQIRRTLTHTHTYVLTNTHLPNTHLPTPNIHIVYTIFYRKNMLAISALEDLDAKRGPPIRKICLWFFQISVLKVNIECIHTPQR